MSLLGYIKKTVEQVTHTRIYHRLPHGVDLMEDLARLLPAYRPKVVFDVGANVGQSAKIYLAQFPDAHIYCFEPVGATFRELERNLGAVRRVDLYQLALGSSHRPGRMVIGDMPEMNYLSSQSPEVPAGRGVPTEVVEVITLDEFCRSREISRIDFLKIDTEGGDLEVLQGGEALLAGQKIDLIEVEAGMNPGNRRHVPLKTFQEYLDAQGYLLFGIYEQVPEWTTGELHLRRTNPVFLSRRLIERPHSSG
jgi:FkbM family methyltransferase